jgi:hypothetical protein
MLAYSQIISVMAVSITFAQPFEWIASSMLGFLRFDQSQLQLDCILKMSSNYNTQYILKVCSPVMMGLGVFVFDRLLLSWHR